MLRPSALSVLALVLSLLALHGATPARRDVVQAEAFQLVGDEGQVWAELGATEQGPVLHFFDREGAIRMTLVHDDAETGLFLRDGDDTIRVGMAQYSHGGGGFALHGPESKGATVLYHKGRGSLTFYDDEGSPRARLPD